MLCVISRVEEVCLSILKSNPPQLQVEAKGIVPTTGWTDGQLLPWAYINQPSDGILDFTFIARKPSGIVNQVERSIDGRGLIIFADWIKGVRVHATELPPVVAMLDDPKCSLTGVEIKDGQVPWPWTLDKAK